MGFEWYLSKNYIYNGKIEPVHHNRNKDQVHARFLELLHNNSNVLACKGKQIVKREIISI
jgi:hypothetical protein